MSVDEVTEHLSVMSLSRHVFDYKQRIETFPDFKNSVPLINFKELLKDWAILDRPLWKKARAFESIVGLTDSETCASCVKVVKSQVESACRIPSAVAAFYLLSLEALLSRAPSAEVDISICLMNLVSALDFELASKLRLTRLQPILGALLSSQKFEERVIQCSFFALEDAFNSSFLTALGKYLSELKGLPEQFVPIAKFLKTAFKFCYSRKEFVEIVDRLSKRNSALAAFLLNEMSISVSFSIDTVQFYDSTIESLCQVDNESVINFMLQVASNLPVSSSLLGKLQKAFKGFIPRTKEIASRFIATLVQGKECSNLPDFGEYLQKELNSEATLTSLVQYCACTHSSQLHSFLAANLKQSQRFNTRAAILSGLLKSDFNEWNESLLKELFSTSFIKEASQPSNLHTLSFYCCAFAALIQNPEFIMDSKTLSDALLTLVKPGGVALGCEKGWAQLDEFLALVWVEKVIAPVVFDGLRPELLELCISSLAWFVVFGKERSFKLLVKKCRPLSLSTIEALSQVLTKLVASTEVNNVSIHRVWKFIKFAASGENLKSLGLAMLCHQEKLLGNGDASWPELVRKHLPSVEVFCSEFFVENEKIFLTNSHFLLISLVSLSPQLVSSQLNLPKRLLIDVEGLLAISTSDWNTFFTEPERKVTAAKPVKGQAPAVDNTALIDAISGKIAGLRVSLSIACSVAQALPFHPSFTSMRPQFICKLLDLLLAAPKLAQIVPLVDSIYTIASESFDGQGPLLISLCLRYSNSAELVTLINPSWSISDDSSLLSSCVEILKKMENDEFFIACETFTGVILATSTEFESLKPLISILDVNIKNTTEAKVSSSCAKMIAALIELAVKLPESAPTITGCLIEFGELEGLCLNTSHFDRMNFVLRSSPSAVRLVVLKFLIAFISTKPGQQANLPLALLKTVWLLHFESGIQSQSVEENEADEIELNLTSSLASKEVSMVAAELFEMLQSRFEPPSEMSILADILVLESEKGGEIHIRSMIDSYISALVESLLTSKNTNPLYAEYSRLLQARNTPNGIVRLTKNVDRSKLDFTKMTRRSLLQVLAEVCKSSTDTGLLSGIVEFSFKTGFADPDECNCQILFDGILGAVAASPEAIYAQLQDELNATAINDRAQVYAVIAVGRAASTMSLDSDRIWCLISRIQETLKVPSESVQLAVADTLVPLLRSQVGDKRVNELFSSLSQRLRESKEDYGVLRGVATGIAAVLQACGTGLIRELDLFVLWTDSLGRLGQKNSEVFVCSSLASIEMASARCGIAFEPYIPPLVPGVLEALGDNRSQVRQDAESCADAMMSALSPLSVSSILPPLLEMAGADGSDPRYSWRAKLGAVTWLGSMAKLAPRILTPALPRIIPALIVALTDAHEKVHLAAHHALAVKYASIIRSPEIKAALPAILRALSDPPKYASSCLGDIIGTSFCHAVDGPSLALLEPLLTRALRERGTGAMTEAKRRAILIIANLGSLMDPVELKPYLSNLIPSLRGVLGDAVPQVRAGASRALGILTRLMHANGINAEVLDRVVPDCFETIFCDLPSVSAIDRAGAALAVSQVSSSWGLDALIKLVDDRVAPCLFGDEAQNVSSASREALLHLLAALPEASPKALILELYRRVFGPDRLLAIFESTADEDEGVREVSAKTCRSLVLRQALLVDLESSMDILLRAAGDGRWRVRFAAFTILTDLLPALVMGEDASRCDTKTRTLSLEMRSRVLSRLYFGRFDGNSHIRNSAFSLWKSIVTHPPRVIMEILPVLVDDCVASLCIEDDEDDEDDEFEEETEDDSSEDDLTTSKSTAASKSLPSSQKSSQSPVAFKLDKYEMATAALRDILLKLADRVLLPFTRRLAHLFKEQPKARPGILAASGILAQTAIVPCLIPPHLRTESTVVLAVQVSRAQLDEALNLILLMMQQGLTADDATGTVISTSVRLLDRLEKGLVGCPALLDKIVNELLSASSGTVVAILCRRPQILLVALTARFKKLSPSDSIDWEWWAEVITASGPFLASQAAGLLAHLLKLRQDRIDEDVEEVVDALLASLASYDPEILYGDPDLQGDDDDDLDDLVDDGLFSFGQLLETLWSARNLRQLTAQIVYRFASQGSFGCERFYDIWLDRLLLGAVEEASAEDCGAALNALVTAAVENGDSCAVIDNCLSAFENRSSLTKNLGNLPLPFISHVVKILLLPVLADTESFSTSERFSAAQFLRVLLAPNSGEACRLPAAAITSLLGALIRTLSDRTSCTERIRAALLALPVHLLAEPSTALACKPFHPQLARLTVNVLKDIIAATESADISFDASHARGEALLLGTRLAAQLMSTMTRIDAFLEELEKFAFLESTGAEDEDDDQIYDEKSIKNARLVLLQIFKSLSSAPVPAASKFVDKVLRGLILLPGSQLELVEAAGACGRELVRCQFVDQSLAAFINQYL